MLMTTLATQAARTKGGRSGGSTHESREAPSGFILKLFQMVKEAPDEVIHWTPSGDAFVIGSDIQKFETQTLPNYFRHNRFQSFVRQLNFYSFRKINRERNVWIYKHELFHRDRPDDLHLVRRRTCPGLDGRKHRFSRRVSESDVSNKGADDSSIESNEEIQENSAKKRNLLDEPSDNAAVKRSRRPEKSPPADLHVDTSVIQGLDKEVSESEDAASDLVSLSASKTDRAEMVEQSLIVSEVAMKLEQYARKAMKSRRSGFSGAVTPPYGSSSNYFLTSSSLLTYDDEYECDTDDDLLGTRTSSSSSSLGVVSVGDESTASDDITSTMAASAPNLVTPEKTTAPVESNVIAQAITNRMLDGSPEYVRGALIVPATVAGFCMSTAPDTDKGLCSKILHLIASCDKLSAEFQLYRSALHPLDHQGGVSSLGFSPSKSIDVRAVTVQQIWEREASRHDAVRDFKTFAVNCIHTLLGKHSDTNVVDYLSPEDKTALERTAEAWLKSVGARA